MSGLAGWKVEWKPRVAGDSLRHNLDLGWSQSHATREIKPTQRKNERERKKEEREEGRKGGGRRREGEAEEGWWETEIDFWHYLRPNPAIPGFDCLINFVFLNHYQLGSCFTHPKESWLIQELLLSEMEKWISINKVKWRKNYVQYIQNIVGVEATWNNCLCTISYSTPPSTTVFQLSNTMLKCQHEANTWKQNS